MLHRCAAALRRSDSTTPGLPAPTQAPLPRFTPNSACCCFAVRAASPTMPDTEQKQQGCDDLDAGSKMHQVWATQQR